MGPNGKGLPLGLLAGVGSEFFSLHFSALFSSLLHGVGHFPSFFVVSYKTLEFGFRLNPFISVTSKNISPTSNPQRLESSFTQKLASVLLN